MQGVARPQPQRDVSRIAPPSSSLAADPGKKSINHIDNINFTLCLCVVPWYDALHSSAVALFLPTVS
jgi:hypothetical protein